MEAYGLVSCSLKRYSNSQLNRSLLKKTNSTRDSHALERASGNWLRSFALLVLIIGFASTERAMAYDVCSDDISGDDSSCVHEDMAQYGVDVYKANLFPGNLGFDLTNGVRIGAGHEDEKDHIYGETGNTLTIGHFWDPDPLFGLVFDPLNQSLLDGGAIFQGLTPNGWQKSQAYWSRSLAEYANQNFSDNTGTFHYLGHVVHHMGDNTIPTHAHVTSHGPGNRDSFENWMSNKFHAGFPLNEGGDFRFEYPDTYNHILFTSELDALTTNHRPKLGRIDPLQYADLDFDIPEVDGLERPDTKLLWLLYTTNQIAEFFAADRDDGQAIDPTGWVRSDLKKMSDAGLKPRTEEQIDAADSADGTGADPDVNGVLSEIRKYSYLRGIRAIGGLYNLFEQTVERKPILTIEIHKAEVKLPNGTCNDGLIRDACDFYSRVSFSPVTPNPSIFGFQTAISGQNEGEELSDKDTINPDFWRWGHAVEYAGFAYLKLQIVDEEDFPYPEDTPVRITPLYADDSDGGKSLILEVDLAKCMRGDAGALKVKNPLFILEDPSTSSQISSDKCGVSIKTLVTGKEDENDGIAAVTFTVNVAEFSPPDITCDAADDLWHATDASILCTASDVSGLENPADASFFLWTDVPTGTETNSAITGTKEVCDTRGNCATAGPIEGNKVDKKAPVISIVEPTARPYTHSETLVLDYTVVDSGSGVKQVIPTMNGSEIVNGSHLDSGQTIWLLTSLPLGSNTFTINAEDNVSNASIPESVTFTIIVTPHSIIDAVNQLRASGDIRQKIVNPLLAKLKNAQRKWNQNQCTPAENMYGAFINHLQAQNDKSITPPAAEILITDAQYLIAHCASGGLTGEIAEIDTDKDGMPDSYELHYGLNPLSALDASEDADLDGNTNLEEFLSQSGPTDLDSDPSDSSPATAAVDSPTSQGAGSMSGWMGIFMLFLMLTARRKRAMA